MEIKHHNFFSVYYPKYIKDSELQDAFMEEAHLFYNGRTTPDYKYNDKGRSVLDVTLLPVTDIRYTLNKYSKDSDRTKHLNEIIDERFVEILINITPIYQLGLLLDYHFNKYVGEADDFFKHLKYIIVPLSKAQISNLIKAQVPHKDKLPEPEHVEELVNNWIEDRKKKGNSTIYSYNEKVDEEYIKSKIHKRYEEAEFFLDLLISEGYIKIEKSKVKDYFIEWFYNTKDFDLQIENGDFAIEDGDFKFVPDFKKDDIVGFLSWFNNERESFKMFLESNGINMDKENKVFSTNISNSHNVIINNDSQINNQTQNNDNSVGKINWTKIGVYIAIIAIIVSILIAVYENWNK